MACWNILWQCQTTTNLTFFTLTKSCDIARSPSSRSRSGVCTQLLLLLLPLLLLSGIGLCCEPIVMAMQNNVARRMLAGAILCCIIVVLFGASNWVSQSWEFNCLLLLGWLSWCDASKDMEVATYMWALLTCMAEYLRSSFLVNVEEIFSCQIAIHQHFVKIPLLSLHLPTSHSSPVSILNTTFLWYQVFLQQLRNGNFNSCSASVIHAMDHL